MSRLRDSAVDKLKDIPVHKLRSWLKDNEDVERQRSQLVRIAIFVDSEAPRDVVGWIKEAFDPQMASGRIHVELLEEKKSASVNSETDAAIIICGGSDSLVTAALEGLVRCGVATVMVGHSALDMPQFESPHQEIGQAVGTNRETLLGSLATWLVDVSDKDLAIAANFPFARKAAAQSHIKATASQNAVVGVVPFIPGSDTAVMTANQVKMILEIAAIYGRTISAERIPELLGVAGGGIALRSVARSAIGLVPGAGWLIRGGLGYTGTIAMGNAMIARFELADNPQEAVDAAVDAARQAASQVKENAAAASESAKTATPATVLEMAHNLGDNIARMATQIDISSIINNKGSGEPTADDDEIVIDMGDE
ncbi:MAG: hypothetical protein IJ125_03900 [Atopobiaceae bacterium]|nr:hypothetical protein [Atopobiaceae bacterium]